MKGDDPNLARVVTVTHPDATEAKKMAAALVEAGVAASVTILPGASSTYMDGANVVNVDEVQMLIKTREGVIGPLKHRIADLHPSETPEILVLPTDGGSGKYIAWIGAQTAKASSR